MLSSRLLLGIAVINAASLFAAEAKVDRALLDAEETYELRLERLLRKGGSLALIKVLEHDMAERPRAYVKAWYANYLLYGAALGVKEFADPKRGYVLAKESRAEGSLFGLELVGRALGDGQGSGYRDTQLAAKCLREAADRGRGSAMCELSKFYFFGIGMRADRVEAEKLARAAAGRGVTTGLHNLARWLLDPKFGSPNPAKSAELYYAAAEYGDAEARQVLRELDKNGDPLGKKLNQLAFVVGARQGVAARPYQIKEAVKWLESNAAPDDWPVQLALAETMIEIRGPVYDAQAAREKLVRAAAAGVDDARALLGTMAWRGIGQDPNPQAAVNTWRELADRGNARALNQLGWLHWWGNGQKYGIEKDATKAFELCRRAADLGYWVAQENTADCYDHGIGTEVNYYLAGKYYGLLDRRGFIHAKEMKDRVLARVKD